MNVFTLIEYKWGGDNHSIDRGQDVIEGDIRISAWDSNSYTYATEYVADCFYRQNIKKDYGI